MSSIITGIWKHKGIRQYFSWPVPCLFSESTFVSSCSIPVQGPLFWRHLRCWHMLLGPGHSRTEVCWQLQSQNYVQQFKNVQVGQKKGRYNMPVVWNAGWNHTICDIFHLTGAEGTTVWLKMCNHRITYNNFKKTSLRFCYKKKEEIKHTCSLESWLVLWKTASPATSFI